MHNNENGFTLIELLVASTVSLILLGILAGVVTSQGNVFTAQNQLNEMQANGRGTTEFMARAVANAGYNVFLGTKFQAASDHYISAVYDADNDGVIQNNEVVTFAPGNTFTVADQTFIINPFFDRNGDGTVSNAETAAFPIGMTLTAPPFNLYQILPNNVGTGVTRSVVARNIDNLFIRYYDNNDNPLPTGLGIVVDGAGLPIPPYNFAANPAQLNQIRRVDFQVLARTKDPRPTNQNLPQGTYPAGSLAAVVSGSVNYNDAFNRQTFTLSQAPRNLSLAPLGKMDVVANPSAVNCPVSTSTVTATLVNSVGSPINGANINFAPSVGATVAPVTNTTNAFGQATTQVSYNWASSNASITVSASTLLADANGTQFPVFSSGIANFQSGTGTFTDLFNGGLDPNWVELDNPNDIIAFDNDAVPGDDSLRMAPSGLTRTVNGCSWQKYQVEFELTPSANFAASINPGGFVGGYLRYVNANSNYSFLVYKHNNPINPGAVPPTGGCDGNDLKNYCLRIIYWDGVNQNNIGTDLGIDFADGVRYKMLAQVEGDKIRAKIWDPLADNGTVLGVLTPLGLADPNPGIWTGNLLYNPNPPPGTPPAFQNVYRKEVQDNTLASGQIGLLGSGFNGANVVFDNFQVTPL